MQGAGSTEGEDQEPLEDVAPFATLREAYARRDPALAASAYRPDATLIYRGGPAEGNELHRGYEAIHDSFAALFDQLDPADTLDLNFRIARRLRDGSEIQEQGVYRLRVGEVLTTYGHFDTRRHLDDPTRFLSDESRPAAVSDFEEIGGPVALDPEHERLEGDYYDALTGRYRLEDGCHLVVTRSFLRLFVRDSCTQRWRGLERRSGRWWSGGDRVLPDESLVEYRFAPPERGRAPRLTLEPAGGETRTAERRDPYDIEPTSFVGADGSTLAGALYIPVGRNGAAPATVMLHGSGPQDRHGFASIIAVLADVLAGAGHVVLAYDKRGVGGSSGDWSTASFATLGADATAAIAHLRGRAEVDPERIALAGSSQAGWVAARAIADGAAPAGLFLLGAAGSALTVEEQNLYNTGVRMRCAGYPAREIELALAQQRTFFDYLRDPRHAAELDRLTDEGRRLPRVGPWLFPASGEVDRAEGAWFTTLELDFDPLPIWREFGGVAHFVFAEHDDSTPTERAVEQLRPIVEDAPGRRSIVVLDGAQHLALEAEDVCAAELTDVSRFHPGLFHALDTFAGALRTHPGPG